MKPARVKVVSSAGRRRGFSLVEMMVALVVLVVAMAIVSNIFALTAQTASTAVAISETQSQVRDFLINLEADLDNIDPSESILVISGDTQAAARTPDDLEAGLYYRELVGDPASVPNRFDPRRSSSVDPLVDQYSNPRTDLLMFLTNRPGISRAPALHRQRTRATAHESFQASLQNGAAISPQLVVYGHAAVATVTQPSGGSPPDWLNVNAPQFIFKNNHQNLSPLPVTQWVLARRASLIENRGTGSPTLVNNIVPLLDNPARLKLAEPAPDDAGDSLRLMLGPLMAGFGPDAGPPPTGSGFVPQPLALYNPYEVRTRWPLKIRRLINRLLYLDSNDDPMRHIATAIEDPPPELATNLNLQALNGCAWFQVEFLMPEDPRNAPDYPNDATDLTKGYTRDDLTHWVEVQPGQIYVFVPDSQENRALIESRSLVGTSLGALRHRSFAMVNPPPQAGVGGTGVVTDPANRRVRMWPYAIRITVRVFDRGGKLESPIVRSLVHRFD